MTYLLHSCKVSAFCVVCMLDACCCTVVVIPGTQPAMPCFILTVLSTGTDTIESVCREGAQGLRTKVLQCATVCQHRMLSHIVEQGRERCHQHSTAVSGAGQRSSKAFGVLQTWPMKSHSLCLHAMGCGMGSLVLD